VKIGHRQREQVPGEKIEEGRIHAHRGKAQKNCCKRLAIL
jgi:hypothetical protein